MSQRGHLHEMISKEQGKIGLGRAYCRRSLPSLNLFDAANMVMIDNFMAWVCATISDTRVHKLHKVIQVIAEGMLHKLMNEQ